MVVSLPVIPEQLSFDHAASPPIGSATAWEAIFRDQDRLPAQLSITHSRFERGILTGQRPDWVSAKKSYDRYSMRFFPECTPGVFQAAAQREIAAESAT